MKPLRLEIEGFTSFRDPVEIDFRGRGLFAISGPTGAGKSSILDAMIWSLYARVPRAGSETRRLISHGASSMRATLEFEAGGETWRVSRRSPAQTGARLERARGDGFWDAVADRSADVTRRVEELIGLDYDAFVRTVLLPQGECDRFLRGDRAERRGILSALLGLDAFERAGAIARRRETRHRAIAEQSRAAIARLPAHGPGAAAAAAADAKRARAAAASLDALGDAMRSLRETAAASARADGLAAKAEGELSAAAEADGRAREAANRAAAEADASRAAAERARAAESALGYDADAHDELRRGAALAAERRRARSALQAADRELRAAAERERDAKGLAANAASFALAAAADSDHAETELAEAGRLLEEAQRGDMAAALRASLSPGDACPVCGGGTGGLAHAPADGEAEALLAARTALRDSRGAGRAAAASAHADARAAAEAAAERARSAREAREAAGRALESARAEAERTGLRDGVPDGGEAAALRDMDALAERCREAAAARAAADTAAEVAAERAALRADEAERAAAGRGRREAEAGREREAAADARRAFALAWERAGADGDPDPERAGAFADGHAQRQRRAAAEAAEAEAAAARILADERQAAELAAQAEHAERERDLASTLANDLRRDRFVDWRQRHALTRLAEGASRWLHGLSDERYSLIAPGEQGGFRVADAHGGGEERAASTLSGGETFLASLALALALAEELPALSERGGAMSLDALFVDEGFGALDSEALEKAIAALERLAGGERMVGVISHVDALTERIVAEGGGIAVSSRDGQSAIGEAAA